MLIQIKHRRSLKVLFEHEAENNSMALTLKAAIAADANLSYSNLSYSNLRGSDLSGSNLSGANLSGANLSDADLRGADLRGANLSDADLSDANLRDANLSYSNLSYSNLSGSNLRGSNLSYSDLRGANLSYSNLRGSNLSGSNLRGSNLSYSDLRGANLSYSNLSDADLLPIKADFIEVISRAPREVPALIEALKEGRVDGSTYEGSCACLVGTIANVRGTDYRELSPDASRPAERFFFGIRRGDTPETNAFSQIALEWAETWLATQRAAFSPEQ